MCAGGREGVGAHDDGELLDVARGREITRFLVRDLRGNEDTCQRICPIDAKNIGASVCTRTHFHARTQTHKRINARTHKRTNALSRKCECTHARVRACALMNMHRCTGHMYTHTCVHTHMYAHMCTHCKCHGAQRCHVP